MFYLERRLKGGEQRRVKKADNVRRQQQPVIRRVLRLLKGRWALLLGLVAFAGVLLAVPDFRRALTEVLTIVSSGDGLTIRNTLRSYGPLAPVVSIALILLHAIVPLPAELLVLANGLMFGFWGGLAISWSGFVLSALSIYVAGRLWGRPLLERIVSQRHQERLDSWLAREGALPLLMARLIPLVPFNAVCLAAGAVRAPLWTYTWTTGVGILPLAAIVTFLGSYLGESSLHLGTPFWILSLLFVVSILAFWWIVRRRVRRRS